MTTLANGLGGFTDDGPGQVRADLASQGLARPAFRQLFLGDQRQPLARHPNADPNQPYTGGWAYADGKPVPMYQDVPGESRRALAFKAADLHAWSHPEEGEVFVFPRYNWWNNLVRNPRWRRRLTWPRSLPKSWRN